MKNTITTLFSLLLMFSIVSCKKEGRDRQEVKAVVLNETVAPGTTHDIADLEDRGMVGVFIASDVFVDAAVDRKAHV